MKRIGTDVSAVDTILPVLEPGDHLTAAEFDRRYALRKDIQRPSSSRESSTYHRRSASTNTPNPTAS